MRARIVTAVLVATALIPLGSSADGAPLLRPCTIAGGFEAECATLTVPEDRATEGGRTIGLTVAVVRARTATPAPDPLVYLAGGPGGAALSEAAPFAIRTFADVLRTRDLVLVDQRGTGRSNRLTCAPPSRGTTLETPKQIRAFVRTCLDRLETDPRLYTTIPAMDDLADVLEALGYGAANVYGGSYGATAAQYFMHQHPELVRTVVLDGGTLLDVPLFEVWGRNGERAMRQILSRCARSPRCSRAYPRVRAELFEVLAGLRRAPVKVDGQPVDAATAAGVFQLLSRSPEGAAQIPWIANHARAGDWTPFALARDDLDGGTTRLVMSWAITCSEPWARQRPAKVAAGSAGTYLAERTALDARVAAAVCSAFPKSHQPAWTAERVRSDAPVLIVVGGADPQDPVANVANARRELPRSRTLVVPAGGHGSVQLGCVPQVVARFLAAGTVAGLSTECVARYTPPPFVVVR